MKRIFNGLLLIFLVSSFQFPVSSKACTNFLVSKGASADGSVMISYAADSHTLYGELYFRPAKDYPEGTFMDIYEWDTGKKLGQIKQARHTYSVVGNMNEFQVAIGETTFGGLNKQDTNAIMDYGSLMYITLQRAKTAREAIKIFGELTEEYGYYSEGESFSISDANEVWILELVGKGPVTLNAKEKEKLKGKTLPFSKGALWVAVRIPDGYISGHANQARITTFPLNDPQKCIYSKDVITWAREKGMFKGKDEEFSFADVYAPLTYGAIRACDARVWCGFYRVNSSMKKYESYIMGDVSNRLPLYIMPDHKITVQDVQMMMRDHYEGTILDMTKDAGAGPFTLPYRWRPMTWKVDNQEYCNERAVSTQQTGFSFVTQSRGWLPNPIGGINWFGVDDTYSTVYVPIYCGSTAVPETFAEGNGNMITFTWDAAFWVFNFVSNFSYLRYKDMIKDVQKVQKELEDGFQVSVADVDKKAAELYKTSPDKAKEYITTFSKTQGNMTVDRWRRLGQYLLVKYMDGNIKKEKDGHFLDNGNNPAMSIFPSQPGYDKDYYKSLVNDDPTGHLKMKKLPNEKPEQH